MSAMQAREALEGWMAQRAILFQLLRDEHDERWTLSELKHAISDLPLPEQTLDAALARLEREGVAARLGEHVLASRCASHMDALGVVSI
jgi:hypothetical protein